MPDDAEAQRERAQQAWELVIDEPADDAVVAACRRILRLKRFEIEAFRRRLPGSVRRGARLDLEPLAQALLEANIRCSVRRRAAAST